MTSPQHPLAEDTFNAEGRTVLANARVLGSDLPPTTDLHILHALTGPPQNAGSRLLEELGVDLNRLRDATRFVLGPPHAAAVDADADAEGEAWATRSDAADFDTIGAYIISSAQTAARRFADHAPGPEHLLLALALAESSHTAGLLDAAGVTAERLLLPLSPGRADDAVAAGESSGGCAPRWASRPGRRRCRRRPAALAALSAVLTGSRPAGC